LLSWLLAFLHWDVNLGAMAIHHLLADLSGDDQPPPFETLVIDLPCLILAKFLE
jgi:hypothetical protein